ncbi:NERD domain-containing protein [Sphaerisporangium sp. NBC_01403]|uniref:nuclease-related domain-containing protein n=1 Tax=Sphaerisporangium sp. NBC_01403 TaxID=2903599 RepID=UPI00324907B3
MATHEHHTRERGRDVAGASAREQYRAELALTRRSRLIWRAVKAAAPALLVGVLLDWRTGLIFGLSVAAGDWAYCYRTSSAASWRKGAGGERRTGRLLAPLAAEGYTVMHDRAIPRSRANIDHLVIGPSGVWVVDSKAWHRRTSISGHGAKLWIGGCPATSLVRACEFETSAVTAALARVTGRPVRVQALVAVHGARLPRWGGPLVVGGVMLMRARAVRRWIRNAPQVLDVTEAAALAELLDVAFPRYTNAGG